MKLNRNADELVVQAGSWRRNPILPLVLVGAETKGAHFESDVLKIQFTAPTGAKGSS